MSAGCVLCFLLGASAVALVTAFVIAATRGDDDGG